MSTSAWIGFFLVFIGIPLVGYLAAGAQGHQTEVERQWEIDRIKEYWDDEE